MQKPTGDGFGGDDVFPGAESDSTHAGAQSPATESPGDISPPPAPADLRGLASPESGADISPMMRQYREWKQRYPDYLLLFRLGDFYEAFYEDAAVAARTLDITLTSRQKGEGAIPMAGVPHQAVDGYIARLIRAGHRVALCDQVESAPSRGRKLIRREVVRLVTPGTVTEAALLDGRTNNFLAALVRGSNRLGAALVDITTADFWVGESTDADALADALLLRRPAELLVPASLSVGDPIVARLREEGVNITVRDPATFESRLAEERLREHFQVAALEGLGLGGQPAAVRAAAAVLAYLQETQQGPPGHLTRLQPFGLETHLVLDDAAARNLELIESLHDRSARGSLLWAIDRTLTPMGGRLVRQWLLRPLRDPRAINARLTESWAFETGDAAPNPIPSKAMLRVMGLPAGQCRLPLGPAPDGLEDRAREVLQNLGMKVA